MLELRPFEFIAARDYTMVQQKDIFGEISSHFPLFSFSKKVLKGLKTF